MTKDEYAAWDRQGKIIVGIMLVCIVIGVPVAMLVIASWLQ